MYLPSCHHLLIPDNFIPDSLCNKKGVFYDSGDELTLEFSTVNEKVLHAFYSATIVVEEVVF